MYASSCNKTSLSSIIQKKCSDLVHCNWHPNSWIFPSLQLAQLSSHGSALQRLTICPSQVKRQRTEQAVLIESPSAGLGDGWKVYQQSIIEIC